MYVKMKYLLSVLRDERLVNVENDAATGGDGEAEIDTRESKTSTSRKKQKEIEVIDSSSMEY